MTGALPGAIGISNLRVYDWPARAGGDVLCGGSPHMHLACTEAYAVVGGSGAVQTLTARGFRNTSLSAGDVVWFSPGTIHRLINEGDLRIVVMMQNAGLPESGDAVFTFPPAVLADQDAYAAASTVDALRPEESVRKRRDLALKGFAALVDGSAEDLAAFHRAAGALVAPKIAQWRGIWRDGPLAAAESTGRQLDALAGGDVSHLVDADVYSGQPTQAWGMCGRLERFEPVEKTSAGSGQ
ncbi:cupin domain-containing protein [Fodinicola acaciae]|uniref:cupin domain-containing protein n=1 Tax=Fodinicola acaciae TaxID=2681555 RepID=UPI0013D527BD|nr:cupin domain-containing protein [Fodinicola acaciae]